MIFGASSDKPVTTKLTNGYDLFHWIMRKNCFPSFWGRNITGEGRLTQEESAYLRNNQCRIVPVFNEFSEREVTQINASEQVKRVLQALRALKVPDEGRIAVMAHLDPTWCINHNWMLSYANGLLSEGYFPGFIGNTDSSLNFSFNRELGHFLRFARLNNIPTPVVWASEPKAILPEEWLPYCCSDMTRQEVSFWQYGEEKCGTDSAQTVLARDKFVLAHTW